MILQTNFEILDSNIESKSSNNTYLNIIKLFFLIFFFQFEDHLIRKFSNDIDFRKLDFLSEEKISERSGFVNKDVMQSWFNKIEDRYQKEVIQVSTYKE